MNEQIRELALKAMDFQGAIDIDTELKMTNSELAKFAELIVRECVQVAHPHLTDVGEWAAGMRLVQKRLKQHFGVAE
jgi:hypothetical protein